MNQDYYKEEMMVKESISSQKNNQEIGMPDIEMELERVKQMAKKNHPTLSGWHRVAAICTLLVSISGLTWAFYHISVADTLASAQVPVTTATDPITQTTKTDELKVSEKLTLSYDKATLEQIVIDLTAYYRLEKPEFKNRETARNSFMHVTFNQEATVQDAIELLNHFGRVKIELSDNHLVVE